jgi:ribose transport system substrate-binding protein
MSAFVGRVSSVLGLCVVVAVGVLGASATAANHAAAAAPKPPVFAPLVPTQPGSGKGLTIGYISLGESIAYIHTVTKGIQKNAAIAGAKVIVCDSKLDAATALQCAQNFKTQHVDGILNFQVHEDAAPKICAAGPKVPVIAIDINQKPCMISFLGVSNVGAGLITGTGGGKAYKVTNGCKYDAMFIVGETASGSVIIQRRNAMKEGFASVCGPVHDVRLLLGTNTPADAQRLVTDALTAVPSPKKIIVLSTNGDMTLGALAAVRSQNRTDDVKVVGFGADASNLCDLMKNRDWLGDSLLFPERYGQVAVQNIVAAVKGRKIPKTLYIKSEFGDRTNIPKYYPTLAGCKPA